MTPSTGIGQSDESSSSAPIRVLSGNPTPAEVAAVTAVVTTALEELADQNARIEPGPTAWARSQRSVRETIHPGYGIWRSFSG